MRCMILAAALTAAVSTAQAETSEVDLTKLALPAPFSSSNIAEPGSPQSTVLAAVPVAGDAVPEITWRDGKWSVALPVEGGRVVRASWKPGVTYVIRYREVGAERWSLGIESPITTLSFVDFEPDTEYEMQVRARYADGESAPSIIRIRTLPAK